MDMRSMLFTAAAEGAHLRAAASAADGPLSGLGMPRSVILITGEARARLAAEAVVALASDARCPIMVARYVPHFTGALDLVMVLTDDPGDELAARSLAEADRRGAATVLVGPDEGPVRHAASSSTVLIQRPTMSIIGSFCGYIGAVFATLTGAGVSGLGPAAVLRDVADAVDAEAIACSAERDLLVNPARQLAEWVRGRSVVFAGDGEVWRTVAELAAAWLCDAGVTAHGAALTDVLRAAHTFSPRVDDIFFDPEFDDPAAAPAGPPRGAVVLTSSENLEATTARVGELPWVRVECPAEDVEVHHQLVDVCVSAARVAAAAAYVMEE
ncbi:hypothetical protein KRX51_02600 [Corynebacterium sp. TAE3-ERU12]|uniref:hypothetical protein n=1 Tax=Corynebacterium sp. TAE3-ERU12 TaxID=2849491 RepID=UPI001C439765|nr:hypothetical protein [Corynebacterium sp. TAE3-ERU12]MBV7294811.1 hypothetical protein [Corynebacterium sp. TAE3-ERU12]